MRVLVGAKIQRAAQDAVAVIVHVLAAANAALVEPGVGKAQFRIMIHDIAINKLGGGEDPVAHLF